MNRPVLTLLALFASTQAFAGTPRVVGGEQAAEGAWPDAAAICRGPCTGMGVVCTGVLVAPDVVLTAGHCVFDQEGNFLAPDRVMLDSNDFRRTPGEVIDVAWAEAHPTYTGRTGHDIALLKLEHEARTPPRPLARGCVQDEALHAGVQAAIVGYGATDVWGTRYGSKLNEGTVDITDPDCRDATIGCNAGLEPGSEILAYGEDGGSCFGDSGGPLYLQTEYGDYLIGNTSRGIRGARTPCGGNGIYVRPDAVVDWIEDAAGSELPETTCNLPPSPRGPELLEVRAGHTRAARLKIGDPDQDGGHHVEILDAPEHGVASIDERGRLVYSADADGYLGPDRVVVRITDTVGYPSHSADLVVPLAVVEPACGCATTGPSRNWLPGLLAFLALTGLRRRRDAHLSR